MPVKKISLPALSPTMNKTGGTIAKWHKKVGDKISIGEVIAEIETDKTVMEMESLEEGILAKIFYDEGAKNIPVNQTIALLVDKEENIGEAATYTTEEPSTFDNTTVAESDVKVCSTMRHDDICTTRIAATPLAKSIAQTSGIDITEITPNNGIRIKKADVEMFIKNQKSGLNKGTTGCKHSTQSDKTLNVIEFREINAMRRAIAERLSFSKSSIPHFYLEIQCRVDNLLSLRQDIVNSTNIKITVNDFIVKAAAKTLHAVPEANVAWFDETKIQILNSIDISVAVSLADGLITPIVFNAAEKSISTISQEIKILADKAKNGKLHPSEFTGGSLTVSNLGMFGVDRFSAILNPPQSIILAVGAAKKQPIIDDLGAIEIANMMNVTVSVDHRVIDGTLAAKFAQTFKSFIENPFLLLV